MDKEVVMKMVRAQLLAAQTDFYRSKDRKLNKISVEDLFKNIRECGINTLQYPEFLALLNESREQFDYMPGEIGIDTTLIGLKK